MKRRFEFIDEDTYQLLDKKMRNNLLKYREQYRLCRMKEKRINTLQSKLKEQQDLLRDMKKRRTLKLILLLIEVDQWLIHHIV